MQTSVKEYYKANVQHKTYHVVYEVIGGLQRHKLYLITGIQEAGEDDYILTTSHTSCVNCAVKTETCVFAGVPGFIPLYNIIDKLVTKPEKE